MPYFKDHGGSVHYIETAESKYLLPDGCVEITEAEADALVAPTIDQIKASKWGAIKAERDRRRLSGVKVAIGGVDKWFHSDDTSRIQQLGLLMMGVNMPPGLKWKTLDNSFITMTPAIAQQVFTGQAASDQAFFAVAEAHRVAMEASEDAAAYDYSAGWP